MAVSSFYISIKLPIYNKKIIKAQANLKKYKKTNDLIYKDVLYIDNISLLDSWWHINAGLYDFFHSCEMLYEFCKIIEITMPKFTFLFMGKEYEFSFSSLLDFILFVYPQIESKKKYFEESFGALSIPPTNEFWAFRRKNRRFFK